MRIKRSGVFEYPGNNPYRSKTKADVTNGSWLRRSSCTEPENKKPEMQKITADGIAADFIERDVTEHLTDNSKKAIVGVISVHRAGKLKNTVGNRLFFLHRKMMTPQGG